MEDVRLNDDHAARGRGDGIAGEEIGARGQVFETEEEEAVSGRVGHLEAKGRNGIGDRKPEVICVERTVLEDIVQRDGISQDDDISSRPSGADAGDFGCSNGIDHGRVRSVIDAEIPVVTRGERHGQRVGREAEELVGRARPVTQVVKGTQIGQGRRRAFAENDADVRILRSDLKLDVGGKAGNGEDVIVVQAGNRGDSIGVGDSAEQAGDGTRPMTVIPVQIDLEGEGIGFVRADIVHGEEEALPGLQRGRLMGIVAKRQNRHARVGANGGVVGDGNEIVALGVPRGQTAAIGQQAELVGFAGATESDIQLAGRVADIDDEIIGLVVGQTAGKRQAVGQHERLLARFSVFELQLPRDQGRGQAVGGSSPGVGDFQFPLTGGAFAAQQIDGFFGQNKRVGGDDQIRHFHIIEEWAGGSQRAEFQSRDQRGGAEHDIGGSPRQGGHAKELVGRTKILGRTVVDLQGVSRASNRSGIPSDGERQHIVGAWDRVEGAHDGPGISRTVQFEIIRSGSRQDTERIIRA